MSTKRKCRDAIKKIAGLPKLNSFVCSVVSVSSEDASCTVKRIYDNKIIENIRLNTHMLTSEGVIVSPAKDSYVIVTMLDEFDGFISQFSKVDKITIHADNIEFNGGKNLGLIKIKELTDKINELVTWCKNHTHSSAEFTGTMTVGGAVNPISGTLVVPAPSSPPKKLKKEDYENDKITH